MSIGCPSNLPSWGFSYPNFCLPVSHRKRLSWCKQQPLQQERCRLLQVSLVSYQLSPCWTSRETVHLPSTSLGSLLLAGHAQLHSLGKVYVNHALHCYSAVLRVFLSPPLRKQVVRFDCHMISSLKCMFSPDRRRTTSLSFWNGHRTSNISVAPSSAARHDRAASTRL